MPARPFLNVHRRRPLGVESLVERTAPSVSAIDDRFTFGGLLPTLDVNAPGVLANDSSADGGALTAVLAGGPSRGSLTLNPDGSFVYTPGVLFLAGTDSFTYRARTIAGTLSPPATVTVTVGLLGDNRAPAAEPDSYTTAEDTAIMVAAAGVLANDSDPDGDNFWATLATVPANGTVTLNTDGSFTYTPNPDFFGTDGFTYRARDGTLNSNVATVNLTVTPVDDPATLDPIADRTVSEDVGLQAVPLTGISAGGGESQPLTVTATSDNPALMPNPVVTYSSPNTTGTLTFTPAANASGSATITVSVSDGVTTLTRSFVVVVTPVNDAPGAAPDSYTTGQNKGLTVAGPGVLANDTDVEDDALSASLLSGPSQGSLTLNADGSFTYAPNPAFRGTDTFTYRVTDANGAVDNATVVIKVLPPNGRPVGTDDDYAVAEDGSLTVPAAGVLANDTPPSNLPLTARLADGPRYGTLTFNADGSFTYVPNPNFSGTDSFTYKAVDLNGGASGATGVRITVTPLPDAPIAVADRFAVEPDAVLKVDAAGVLGNDTDPDGGPLSAMLVAGPAHGTVTLKPDGSFVYTPDAGFIGEDTFTYLASDGQLSSGPVTVTIGVRPELPTPIDLGEDPKPIDLSVRPVGAVAPPEITRGPMSDPVGRPGDGGLGLGDGGPDRTEPGDVILPPILVIPPVVFGSPVAFGTGPSTFLTSVPTGGPAAPVWAPPASVFPPTLPPLPTIPMLPPPIQVNGPLAEVTPPAIPTADGIVAVPAVPTLLPDNPVFTGLNEMIREVETVNRVQTVTGTVVGTGLAATAGYVLLSPRLAFWFLSALLARRTVWKPFDPLEVVYAWDRENEKAGGPDGDDEALEKMVS